MSRSLLWREFESSDNLLLKALRWLVLLGGLCFLVYTATLELTWPQQLVLGGMVTAIAFWIDRGTHSYLVTLTLVLLSLVSTLRYMHWRVSTTYRFFFYPGTQWNALDAFFVSLLLGAELFAFTVLLLGYLQTLWPLRRMPVPLPEDPENWPAVDLLIPTLNEPLSVVRFTAFAATNIDWPADKLNIYLLDDGNREEFRSFAAEAGIGYRTREDNRHAKAGNINHALRDLDAPFVAIFDADHVPTRSFLQVTMGWFLRDRKLGMLQTPQHFYSPDPFERNLDQFRVIPNEGELFHGIVQDGNDFWNATVFCGSCAVLRRTALDEIGGMAVETVTEDAHTSLRMQIRGWNTAYVNIPQAAGLATERLSSHIKQRIRWARGMAQIFRTDNPLFAPGLRLAQRLCYFNSMAHFLGALPRLIFLTAPLCYLILGHTNIPGYWIAIVAYAVPHLLLSSLTNARIQGRHRHAFWNEIYETVFAPYILFPTLAALFRPASRRFAVTPKGGVVDSGFDTRIAQPYLLLLALNGLGVLLAVARAVHVPGLAYLWDGEHPGTILMNLLWCLFNIVVLGVATAVAWENRQRRHAVRVAMSVPADILLADGTVFQGVTADLSNSGVLLSLTPSPLPSTRVSPGERVQLVFPVLDGIAALPATIVLAEQGRLRAQFDPLNLQQQEALAMVLYSRADTWLGWRQGPANYRPLQSFALILRFSFHGLSHTLREMYRMRRGPRRGFAPSIAPLLVLAVLATLCPGSLLAMQGEQAAPAQATFAPLAPELPTPATSTSALPAPATSSPTQTAASASAGTTAPSLHKTKPASAPSAHNQPQETSANTPQPGSFHDLFPLSDLTGAQGDLVFHGADASRAILFVLPRAQAVTLALLHLRYAASPGLLPALSHLKVSLNGTLFATLPVIKQSAPDLPPGGAAAEPHQSGGILEATLTLPAELLARRNELTFEFIGHYAAQCEDSTNSTLWAQIDTGSTLEIVGPQRALEDDLGLLPAPFFETGTTAHPSVSIAFLRQPSHIALEAAGIVASYFGIVANDRPIRFPVTVGTIPPGNVVLLVENAADLPDSLRPLSDAGPSAGPGSGPTLTMRAHPAEAGAKVLILSGGNAQELLIAAQVLALEHHLLHGERQHVALDRQPAARKPDDAPRWLSTSHRIAFGELVQQPELEGDGSAPLAVSARLPPDLYFGVQHDVDLHLDYRYNALPLGNISTLQVFTNQAYAGSLPLPQARSASASREAVMSIPAAALRPFANTIQMQFAFTLPTGPPCQDAGPSTLEGSILKDSYLDLKGIPHLAVLPNLELFADSGFPFTRIADLAETAVVLPNLPTVDEIEIFLTLLGHFGAQTGYPALNVRVTDSAGMTNNGGTDYLVLGTMDDQPALERLQTSLPVQIQQSGLRIQATETIFSSLEHVWWKVRDTDAGAPGALRLSDGLPDALIEGLEWPRGSRRSVVVILLREHAVAPAFLSAFLAASQSAAISQSVSVLADEQFTSYRIGENVYHLGALSFATRLHLLFSEFPWIVVLATVIVCFVLAGLLRAMLRRHARARLRATE